MEYKYLEKVKEVLGIGGEYQNATLNLLINEVIEDMIDSGVNRDVAMSEKAVGAVAIGVNDLWNYTAGEVKHSPYFDSRCIKLSYETAEAQAVAPADGQEKNGGNADV